MSFLAGFNKFQLNEFDLACFIKHDIEPRELICPVCGERFHLTQMNQPHKRLCGKRECVAKDPERVKKIKATCLKRYGMDSVAKLESSKQKMKKTCMRKYGVEAASQCESIKAKIKKSKENLDQDAVTKKRMETCLEKYGVSIASKSETVKTKAKETCLNKYGVEYVMRLESVKQKTKETWFKNYGYLHPLQDEKILQKSKETCLKKYGVENPLQNKVIYEQLLAARTEKYGCAHPRQNKEILKKAIRTRNKTTFDRIHKLSKQNYPNTVDLINDFESFNGCGYDKQYDWKCQKCGHEFKHWYYNGELPICRKCNPVSISTGHKEILEFVKSIYDGKIIINDRSVISPYELDIYIPDLNLAIEYNGNYWHSEQSFNSRQIKDAKHYHLNKLNTCKDKGIKLINIWEHEWESSKQHQIKHRLSYLLKASGRIYARKCTIKQLNRFEKQMFITKYHLQLDCESSVNLGLFYEDNLVAVMTFGKPRFNENYQWELLRFCSSERIVGGASKLFKYFVKNYAPKSIISYANLAWGFGGLYSALGFSYKGVSEPNYVWVKNNIVLPRYQTQKHKLKDLLGENNFNPDLSEAKNMENNGFLKIYDCGNAVYTMTL